jgi:tetratricopeptide (TPR) repeat protein
MMLQNPLSRLAENLANLLYSRIGVEVGHEFSPRSLNRRRLLLRLHALCKMALGQYEECVRALEKLGFDNKENHLEDKLSLLTRVDLADAYKAQRKYSEAIELFEGDFRIR